MYTIHLDNCEYKITIMTERHFFPTMLIRTNNFLSHHAVYRWFILRVRIIEKVKSTLAIDHSFRSVECFQEVTRYLITSSGLGSNYAYVILNENNRICFMIHLLFLNSNLVQDVCWRRWTKHNINKTKLRNYLNMITFSRQRRRYALKI